MLPVTLLDYTLSLSSTTSRLPAPHKFTGRRNFYSRRTLSNAALAVKTAEHEHKHVLPSGISSTYRQAAPKRVGRKRTSAGAVTVREPSSSTAEVNANALTIELSRRVRELEKVADEQDSSSFDAPIFSEQDILTFYEDVLAHPDNSNDYADQYPDTGTGTGSVEGTEDQYRADLAVIEEAERRLATNSSRTTATTTTTPNTTGVLNHLENILQGIELTTMEINKAQTVTNLVPLPILSKSEWDAMIRVGVHVQDAELVERAIDLIRRCNLPVPEHHVNALLQLHLDKRDAGSFERCLAKFVEDEPSPLQRHWHVKVHLPSTIAQTQTQTHAIPLSTLTALSILHVYESRSIPAPLKTYSFLIHHLFSLTSTTTSALAQAQAWDLFSHMRYVAHPVPDAILYTQMIRACASYPPSSSPSPFLKTSDPERALDLWTEMTVDHGMEPLQGTWDAVILACARSNGSRSRREKYVNEAFRLARQMLDSHRDAYGRPKFVPSKKTFCALLEGAKRIGELGRVRWILAEMVKQGRESGERDGVEVDEEVMMHVFHAYAAYTPQFRRGLAKFVEKDEDVPEVAAGLAHAAPAPASVRAINSTPTPTHHAKSTQYPPSSSEFSAFSHVPPQTDSEVIIEVDILFNRILHESRSILSRSSFFPPFSSLTSHPSSLSSPSSSLSSDIHSSSTFESSSASYNEDQSPLPMGKFSSVNPTTPLLNAYLATYYAHSSLESSRNLFEKIFPTSMISGPSFTQTVNGVGTRFAGQPGNGTGFTEKELNIDGLRLRIFPDAHTYLQAIERCATAQKHERAVALEFAENVFKRFEEMESEVGIGSVSPRIIERVHVAWIRVLALTNNIDRALFHLRTFVARYPPSDIRYPSTSSTTSRSTNTQTIIKPAFRSTRTSLTGSRPLVRLTSPALPLASLDFSALSPTSDVGASNESQGAFKQGGKARFAGQIPPLIMWRDLEVLHHRIVAGVTGDAGRLSGTTTAGGLPFASKSAEVDTDTDLASNTDSKDMTTSTPSGENDLVSLEQKVRLITAQKLRKRREAREKKEKDLGYIKWVSKSYEWALRVRRDEAMKAGVMMPAKTEDISEVGEEEKTGEEEA